MRWWLWAGVTALALAMRRSSADPQQLTPHFHLREFASRGQLPTDTQTISRLRTLAENLEVLRRELGRPIVVISGWRSQNHNEAIDGATQSQHLFGRAADIVVAGMTPAQVFAAIERLQAQGKMEQGGLAAYDSFTHYDTRGYPVRW